MHLKKYTSSISGGEIFLSFLEKLCIVLNFFQFFTLFIKNRLELILSTIDLMKKYL